MEIKNIKIDDIQPDKNQPRKYVDKENVENIAQSYKTHGIINPIEVDEKNVIITGELRWRAAKLAGLKEIPCSIIKIDKETRLLRQLTENENRYDMNDWDRAVAFKKAIDCQAACQSKKPPEEGDHDQGIRSFAAKIGKSHEYVRIKLAILKASLKFQKAIKSGKIPSSMIEPVMNSPGRLREKVENKILKGDFSSRDGAKRFVTALKDYPEKEVDLLKEKFQGNETDVAIKLEEIIPEYSETPIADEIRESVKPVTKLGNIVLELDAWLENNPPEDIAGFQLKRAIGLLIEHKKEVEKWLKQE